MISLIKKPVKEDYSEALKDGTLCLLNFIPLGKHNSIKRKELVRLTGLHDNVMRAEIARLRREYCIINDQTGRGYYIPLPNEIDEIRAFIKQETSRLKSIGWSLMGAKNELAKLEGKNQIELEDIYEQGFSSKSVD